MHSRQVGSQRKILPLITVSCQSFEFRYVASDVRFLPKPPTKDLKLHNHETPRCSVSVKVRSLVLNSAISREVRSIVKLCSLMCHPRLRQEHLVVI